MKLTDRVAIPAQVMARQVGQETVILDLASGTYFGLDTVGARVWILLFEGKTIGEICRTMLDEYEVEPAPLEKDVFSLLQSLERQGLVKIEEA